MLFGKLMHLTSGWVQRARTLHVWHLWSVFDWRPSHMVHVGVEGHFEAWFPSRLHFGHSVSRQKVWYSAMRQTWLKSMNALTPRVTALYLPKRRER